MKKVNLFFVAMFISGIAFSQWNIGGNPANKFGATNWALWGNNIRSIGIGHKQNWFTNGWTAQNPPRAALHVNAHFLSAPPAWAFTPGQVFRTDGPSGNDNMWQMFTGANYDSSTEKGRFYAKAGEDHLYLWSPSGDMRFNVGTYDIPSVRILKTNGFVGIGNYNGFVPQHLLHLNSGDSPVGFQMTVDGSTGTTANDGLLIGGFMNGTIFNVRIWNQENGQIQFHILNNQIMRMYPNGNVAIGDQTMNPPTENLDVQRNVRIRQMPPTTQSFNTVLIDGNGVLWQGPPSGGGGADADWFDQNNIGNPPTTINDEIYTFNNVAIGANSSITSRTYVYNDNEKMGLYVNSEMNNSITTNFGTFSWAHGSLKSNIGVSGNANTYSKENIGVYGRAIDATNHNKGVYGEASGTAAYQNIGVHGKAVNSLNYNFGVFGEAYGGAVTYQNIGVYGKVIPNSQFPNNIGGLFEGGLAYTGYFANVSDIKLKENIQNITNAVNIINQLQPKTFNFKTNDYPELSLASGLQYGLIAQDVEPILPELVKEIIHPAEYDSLGNIVTDSIHYKAITYQAFIPILIASVKEQQTLIDSMQQIINSYESRFQQIEAQLASCCGNNNKSFDTNDNTTDIEVVPANEKQGDLNRLYQNNPNPFKRVTQFKYHLGTQGFVELEIRDAFGRLVTTLINQNQTNGTYSLSWDSANIAPGVYFYSLKVNNEVIVKKAVKLK